MLVNMKKIVEDAAKSDYAVPGFNVFGYEDAAAIVAAAEEVNCPVILMTNRDAVAHMPFDILGGILKGVAANAKVPVCVHLDHGKTFEEAVQAIKAGYTSVMYDGSQLPLEENIKNTKEIVRMAHAVGVTVEAEIGSVGYDDPSIQATAIYTEPEEAKQFADETGVDALAVAIGTLHRMQTQAAKIQYDRLDKIQELTNIPIVIHGSTGIVDEDLQKLVKYRVAKINIGTALRMAFGYKLRETIENNPEEFDRIKFFKEPMEAVKKAAKEKMLLLGLGK